jgi:phage protein D
MTETLLTATAPVFKVDGAATGALARDLLDLTVAHSTQGLATLEATVLAAGPGGDDAGRLNHLDGSPVDFGTALEVSIGPAGDEKVIFSGLVSAIEARFAEGQAPRAVIFAEDALMELRLTRRSRTYEQTDDAGIARTIAGEHGLQADCDVDGPTYDVVQQWQQSDLAFLRDRARLVQAELWVDQDGLHFVSRDKRTATEVVLAEHRDLLACDLRADLAHQRTEVVVSGYDADARAVIEESAGADTVRAEVTGGRTGPEVLQGAFGDRPATRARDVPLTGAEARAWARAEMLRRCRGFVTGRVISNGNPTLVVGSRITLEGVGPAFEGSPYYATRVVHTYDLDHGHRTHVELERATVTR